MDIFKQFQIHINNEQKLLEEINNIVKEIDLSAKLAATILQSIHCDLSGIPEACKNAREQFANCKETYEKLIKLVPDGMFFKYSENWNFLTQRIVFLIALTYYLETGELVSKEKVAEMLRLKTIESDKCLLDIEDYLMGLLLLCTELARFSINSVTQGDYKRPLHISHFVADLNSGFRLLNLKNDILRRKFDALKYDVKKIEEIVYDISIRGLATTGSTEK